MNFLPQNYKSPTSSNNYAKLVEGQNRFRILSAPVLGWEDWEDKKPVRFKFEDKPKKSINPKIPVRHFWSMVVWNHNDEAIQILHLTQASIRNAIKALCDDPDWGAPYGYDIKINKTGEGKDTTYIVNPLPHKPVDEYIIKAFKEKPCSLESLFDNTDPFASCENPTIGVFSNDQPVEFKEKTISLAQAEELNKLILSCSEKYQDQLWTTLNKDPISIQSIEQLPEKLYPKIKTAAMKKKDEYQAELEKENF